MARPRHKQADLAQYLYVQRGITDMAELARMTGISASTLERYRADMGWVELRQAEEDGRESNIESLDDVADMMIRLMLQKAQQLEMLPVEMVDEDLMKGMKSLVETVKMLTAELRRMSKRDKLLVAYEITDYCIAQEDDQAFLNRMMERIGGFCDDVLAGAK